MKVLKKVVSLVSATVLTVSLATINASAASSAAGSLDGCMVEGSSSITKYTAVCRTTSCNTSATLEVSATYTYYDTKAGLVKTMTDTTGWHGPDVSVSFSVAGWSGCGSISVKANHKAWYNGQSWSASTDAYY